MARKVKTKGQVYTPFDIVSDVLDAAKYCGEDILQKHVMENSCGPGAFLVQIIDRYISEFLKKSDNLAELKTDLETYIHCIDIDPENIPLATESMNSVVQKYGLTQVDWDINLGNSMLIHDYDGKMDYVVGNPPYVRVHNLNDTYDDVKQYKFAQDGMTDLYIVFFEIGLRMLKKDGILSYITANSYYSSLAGTELRKYIRSTGSLFKIMDLGHYNPFKEVTYTTISCFQKNKKFDEVEYYSYDVKTGKPSFKDKIPYSELFVDGYIVLMQGSESRRDFAKIYAIDRKKYPTISVKNGFATLADSIFIRDDFEKSDYLIDVCKASTGQWKKCIYPYDKNGHIISFDQLDPYVQKYLSENKDALEKRSLEKKSTWYSFGRSQAISDVYKNKIAISALVRDVSSIKMEQVLPGQGVYSGIYILTDYSFDEVERVIKTEDFVKYVRAVNKCKNGGYFTFSTDDLNKYLIFKLCEITTVQATLF